MTAAANNALQAVSSVSGLNRFINGRFNIDQRNAFAAQSIVAGAALAYTADRWYAHCTGANVTGQVVAGAGKVRKRYRFTGAASVSSISFGQRIEAVNSYDLVSDVATLSVELSNSLLTTVTWTAYYANTEDTFGSIAVPTRTQFATGTFTVTATPQKYVTSFDVPLSATNGIEIVFSVGAQVSGTWTIAEAKLESGPFATPQRPMLIDDELRLCFRYFQSLRTGNYYVAGTGSSAWYLALKLNGRLRSVIPTITKPPITNTAYSTTGASFTPTTVDVNIAPTNEDYTIQMSAGSNFNGWPTYGPILISVEL